jgi:hypothetical protein
MKFKTIFVLFNVVIVLSFIFIMVMPFYLLGSDYSLDFWARNWPLVVFFLLVLSGFNIFFISNWRLFTALEDEDWKTVIVVLGDRVLTKHRHDRRTIRLLVNAALLLGDVQLVQQIEEELRARRPAALRRDAVLFALAHLLRNDPVACERFLQPFIDAHGSDNSQWIGFYHAFSLVMQKRAQEAVVPLVRYLDSSESVLALLSAYLVGILCSPAVDVARQQELQALAEGTRRRLAEHYSALRWARECEKAKGEMHIVILSKILDDASSWLFAAGGTDTGRPDTGGTDETSDPALTQMSERDSKPATIDADKTV